MRARKKKNTTPRLEKCAEYITEEIVVGDRPLWLEIGCGKGKFAVETAAQGDCDYFALEKVPDVMVIAAEKAAEAGSDNLKFILGDAETLDKICPSDCVDMLFLNFSDPWPKRRDAKRRLTSRGFLEKYRRILKPDGILSVKTDNKLLFDFTVEELQTNGYEIFDYTEDLHNSGIFNYSMTEYEIRFTELGQPIYHVKARPDKNFKPREGRIFEPIESSCGIVCSASGCEKFGKTCNGCNGLPGENPLPTGACEIKKCIKKQGIAHCGNCESFPCDTFMKIEHTIGLCTAEERLEKCNKWKKH